MRGGSLGKGGCITYRRIISCVGGAFLHHCSYNHRDTVSNSAITQSAIWDLHSQQFVMCTVSNLAFTLSAFWHLHNQQFGIYTVSNLGQQLGNYRVSDLANVDGPAAALRWKDHPTVMRYAVQHIKHCLHCIPVELRASGFRGCRLRWAAWHASRTLKIGCSSLSRQKDSTGSSRCFLIYRASSF